MAGVTQLFYLMNYFHDWYYDAGFDEASGNGQTSNFGRGGLGNDAVIAIAQDYSDLGNAFMTTPADGQHPVMHNFLWPTGATLSKVLAPAAIAGVKQYGPADFGAANYDVSNGVVQAVDAGNATGPATTDGCTAITNAAAVAGKIALIDRGTCTFAVKAKNAQVAGAAAVVIANNVAGGLSMTADDPSITIPVVSVTLADGNAIKAQLAASAAVAMRIARAEGVLRDGAIDTLVVAHEWGHYISNRLVGDSNGLDPNQAGGMGEGWADFHQMLLLVKDADRNLPNNANFGGTYASNTYLLGGPDFAPDVVNNAYYYGDRRYPYTRDLAKNPLTFRHIADNVPLPAEPKPSLLFAGPDNSEVHNTGEVWGSLLWECYSNLLNDTARLTFAQAQDRMKRYLVGGYKVTPINPTFVTARDALLAVMKSQDNADYEQCLHGFAKRGAGLGRRRAGRVLADEQRRRRELQDGEARGRYAALGDRVLQRGLRPLFHDGHPGRDREARQRHVRRLGAHRPVVRRVLGLSGGKHGRVPLLQHVVHAAQLALLHVRSERVRRREAQQGLAVRGRGVRPPVARTVGRLPCRHAAHLPAVQQRPGRRAQSPLHDERGDPHADDRAGLDSRRLRPAGRHHVLAGLGSDPWAPRLRHVQGPTRRWLRCERVRTLIVRAR